jgi:hypothetical protein
MLSLLFAHVSNHVVRMKKQTWRYCFPAATTNLLAWRQKLPPENYYQQGWGERNIKKCAETTKPWMLVLVIELISYQTWTEINCHQLAFIIVFIRAHHWTITWTSDMHCMFSTMGSLFLSRSSRFCPGTFIYIILHGARNNSIFQRLSI